MYYIQKSTVINPTVENEPTSIPAGTDRHGMEQLSNENGWENGLCKGVLSDF